jgi:hypothetical protein
MDFLFRPVSAGEKSKSAGQCRVPTKRNFSSWSEPSEIKSIAILNEKGSLRKVILGSNGLKYLVVEP